MAAALPIPAKLAATVVQWTGDRGRDWLARLPDLVEEVARAWDLEVGAPLEPGGNISWVAPVRRRGDDAEAVLKVQLPDPESEPEAVGLAAWAGDGAVELFAHDPARRALLLERCRPGRALEDEGGTIAAVEAGATIGRRLHAATAPPSIPSLVAVLGAWADEVEGRLEQGSDLDPGVVALALTMMREQPARCRAPALLHGDLNPTNVLAAARSPWLAIDPKPMLGDPAYDGPRLVLQPDPSETADPAETVAARLGLVADVLEVDRALLARWCVVDAVQIGSFGREHQDPVMAATCDTQVDLLLPHVD